RRIGIYLYEGTDSKQAMVTWREAYDSLQRTYGPIEIPDIHVAANSDAPGSDVLAIAAAANVDAVGRTQMAPVKQPSGMFVYSTFARRDILRARYYYVIIFIDRRN